MISITTLRIAGDQIRTTRQSSVSLDKYIDLQGADYIVVSKDKKISINRSAMFIRLWADLRR